MARGLPPPPDAGPAVKDGLEEEGANVPPLKPAWRPWFDQEVNDLLDAGANVPLPWPPKRSRTSGANVPSLKPARAGVTPLETALCAQTIPWPLTWD